MSRATTAARLALPLAALLAIGTALALASTAAAHRFAPALLELRELEAGRVAVSWKQPLIRVMGSELRPVLPPECSGIGEPRVERDGTGMRASWELACPTGLVGRTLGVEGIAGSRADVLVRVALEDGRSFRSVLTGDSNSFVVPENEGKLGVFRGYTVLGVDHILGGWDHLLFVLGLVLLVGWGRPLLWTVTAFTLGHSVTLALAVLGFVSVPQAPIEAAIALSIYFLAVELVRSYAGRDTLVQRAPWLVAGGFGLLHGLGFAGALTKVGLPPEEIPLALFSFNVGIELGQLLFVAAVVLAWVALRRLALPWPRWSVYVPAYGIGSLAAFWFFERLVGMLPPAP